jgi:hypothetical protein
VIVHLNLFDPFDLAWLYVQMTVSALPDESLLVCPKGMKMDHKIRGLDTSFIIRSLHTGTQTKTNASTSTGNSCIS